MKSTSRPWVALPPSLSFFSFSLACASHSSLARSRMLPPIKSRTSGEACPSPSPSLSLTLLSLSPLVPLHNTHKPLPKPVSLVRQLGEDAVKVLFAQHKHRHVGQRKNRRTASSANAQEGQIAEVGPGTERCNLPRGEVAAIHALTSSLDAICKQLCRSHGHPFSWAYLSTSR